MTFILKSRSSLSNRLFSCCAIVLISACSAQTHSENTPSTPKHVTSTAQAQTTVAPEPKISIQDLGDGFFVLVGPGGNIGVSSGPDGLFVIDDKFDDSGAEIITRLKEISDQPIRYVLNTHYHGDHSGSNHTLKAAGAIIVAHENVRSRMGKTFDNKLFGGTVKAVSADKWPTLTYSEDASFYINGQTVTAMHTPAAHTDGDSIIYFEQGDVLHMGDNFFNGMFPYIDIDAGGSLQGMIASHDKALALAGENTKIIPGHGPLANKADLMKTRDILRDVESRVQKRINNGENLYTIIESNILSDLKQYAKFIDEKNMIKIAHRSLTER